MQGNRLHQVIASFDRLILMLVTSGRYRLRAVAGSEKITAGRARRDRACADGQPMSRLTGTVKLTERWGICAIRSMSKIARDPLYRRHRFPAEIIAHAVWLYFRFPLSLRMVEDMLAARGIIVTHQTIRTWAEKFGRHFANEIRRRSAGRLGDKWHLDEVVVSIAGTKHWLWRAVDQDGFVLDVLVQSRRNAKAARRLMRKLLKGQGRAPRVMITDKLGSYAVAGREIDAGRGASPA